MKMRRLLVALITLLGCSAWAAKDTCFDCHLVMEGMSVTFSNDIHFSKAISCANCHGGDASEPNQNISMNASRGFKVRVTRQGVPAHCGSCHSDTNMMSKYQPQIPADQLAKYQNSAHGKQLAAGVKRAAECVDCHGVHSIRAVNDPLSSASPQRITRTCTKCHASTAQAYANTRHARIFTNQRRPGCATCHSNHDIQPATKAMLDGPKSVCVSCHRAGTGPANLAKQMAQILDGLEKAGPDSKEALERARIAVHSMNLATVRQAAQPIAPPPKPQEN
jgi:hypothetical protein